jgi:hypothetical protein
MGAALFFDASVIIESGISIFKREVFTHLYDREKCSLVS